MNDRGWAALKGWIEAVRGEDDFDARLAAERELEDFKRSQDMGFFHTTTDMNLEYWCRDAEELIMSGELPIVYMEAASTRSGREEAFTFTPNMLTVRDEEEDA